MRWLVSLLKAAAYLVGALLMVLAATVFWLRLDKEHVFYEVRGRYDDVRTLETRQTAASRARLIELRNLEGVAVATAWFRRPAALAGEYRVIVMYAGAKTGEKILELIPERPDVVLVAMQYPYDSPDTLVETLQWPADIRRAVFRTVAGGMLAVDFVEQHERLDVDRLAVVGVSVGVPFATMHGALDERVPTVMLIHGGGDLPAQVRATVEPPSMAFAAGLIAEMLFHTFEPLRYVARIAPRQLVIVAARDESMIPLETIEGLYAAAGEPKQLIWTESDHVRSARADIVQQIIREIDRYLGAPGEARDAPQE